MKQTATTQYPCWAVIGFRCWDPVVSGQRQRQGNNCKETSSPWRCEL